jgi:RNA polymerase sigma factor FliA
MEITATETASTKNAGTSRPTNFTPAIKRRNEYVTKYHSCVEKVARRLARRLPRHVDLDDLVSAGMIGLIEAADRFDPDRGERFESFAEFRIRGAMLDDLRSRDSLSRDMRRICKQLQDASSLLTNQLGRKPTEAEVARHMGIAVEEVHARQAKVSGSSVVGFDDADPAFLERIADDKAEDPCEVAAKRELFGQMVEHIDALNEKMRQVLALYYCDNLNLKEIGLVLGVTESRICQLHSEATKRLRVSLGQSFFQEMVS